MACSTRPHPRVTRDRARCGDRHATLALRSTQRARGCGGQPAAGPDVLGRRRRIVACSRRPGTWLYALDAATGKPVRTFGDNGSIHLGRGLGLGGTPSVRLEHARRRLQEPADRRRTDSRERGRRHPGLRRADGRTEMDVPHDPPTRRRGLRHLAARCVEDGRRRLGLVRHSVDKARGIVYVSTETAGPDFWGGDRYGANLFANSVVALDAATGKRLWHYQIVHHDLLGSGPAGAADTAHRHARGQAHRCGRAGHQARTAVCLRSRHRSAAVAGRTNSRRRRHASPA